ncbi:TPA: hypothetical protein ACX3EJ_004990 [Vibrio parahaemolyticus]|uniref:hypothetical protein n=1 Tax=Vibrio parahaemolyticus TaxID=670 RepID=UPI000A3959FF|nr:hypothetical protein [Vibrio parahaemolyticus]EGQ8030316.1 excisionase [Vibrio parahaemolyticus]EHV9720309.1 hypothetical protein [Vibrio parahaemolyticus]OUJ46268.1 hypothetical protein BTZ53_10645 [Vibrio parahaemolyticus]HCG6030341.1 hypothetical protein [Vibrio parahaemolyticus]HCG6035064.1 hypothetical protein [Vibrio parahaemolyticus]
MEIMPLSKYCELSGESKEAIMSRTRRGVWLYGNQVLKLEGIKELYIDTAAIAKWARDPKNHVKY